MNIARPSDIAKSLLIASAALCAQAGIGSVVPIPATTAQPSTKWTADCTPNYANKLQSTSTQRDGQTRLQAQWSHWPVKVAVVDDGRLATAGLVELAKSACRKWVVATSCVPEGSVSFDFAVSQNPDGADVVIEFCRRRDIGNFKGFSKEMGTWLKVWIACKDLDGKDEKPEAVLRCLTHEMGHVLGIWGHSPDPQDVMSLNENPCEISVADVNTLRLAYRKK
jgi:hypothetical protein